MRLDDRTRPWWTLVGACAGLFILMMDSTVVALALPEIERELDASAAALQWVMNGYLLVVAVLVVTAGRLGDMFGRRLLFVVGMTLFAAGSVLAATAWDDGVLVGARVIQGMGAAPMLTLSLAIVSNIFPEEKQAQAIGIWAGVSSIALAIGPLAGGALVELDWRLIFWINLPVAAAGIAIMLAAAPESRDTSASRHLDVPGLITLSGGLGALVLGFVESDVWGWTAPHTLILLGAGVVLLGAFWFVEHRVADPILEFSLFRNGPYLGATAAAFALVGSYWVVMFFQAQYLQTVLEKSPVVAGLLILPITAPMIAISPASGPLIARFGSRALMTTGMVLGTLGIALLTRIGPNSSYLDLMPGYALFGIALGFVYAPMSTAAMTAMPREKVGIAAGVLAMNRVLAGAVALAICGSIFQSLRSDEIAAGKDKSTAFAFALADSTWFLVGLLAVGSILTWLLVRDTAAERETQRALQAHEAAGHHRRFHL